MTDHHDDLASAYLDGQLSPEESARVEGDPRLMAEVEALAGVVERLQSEEAPADPGTRQRHLSAALAAFDQLGLDPSSAPTNVIALDTAGGRTGGGEPTAVYPQPDDIARRTARVASAPAHDDELQARRRRSRQRQGLPSWLSAAAALLVIGGGIGWFVSRQNQSQDTANVSFDAESAEGSRSNDAALSQEAESGAPLTTVVNAAEAPKSAEDNAAGGASDIQAAVPADATTTDAAASLPPSTTTPAPTAVTSTTRGVTTASPASSAAPTTAGPGELVFSSAPTGAEVQARLTSTGGSTQPPGGASCGSEVVPPPGTTLAGYVPITVNGLGGEALFYRAASGSGGTTVLVVRTSSCQPFS